LTVWTIISIIPDPNLTLLRYWRSAARRTAPPVRECEFVVARCQRSLLFEEIDVTFGDVAAFVGLLVKGRGPAPTDPRRLR
jgi:hypothetical protein